MEGQTATLRCELSKAAAVVWKKGNKTLRASEKYIMREEGALAELEIRDLEPQDAGDYTCVCGDQHSTASLTVKGKCRSLSIFCFSETPMKCSSVVNLCPVLVQLFGFGLVSLKKELRTGLFLLADKIL